MNCPGTRTDEQKTVAFARAIASPRALAAFMAMVREHYTPRESPFKQLPALDAPLPPEPTDTQPHNAS